MLTETKNEMQTRVLYKEKVINTTNDAIKSQIN